MAVVGVPVPDTGAVQAMGVVLVGVALQDVVATHLNVVGVSAGHLHLVVIAGFLLMLMEVPLAEIDAEVAAKDCQKHFLLDPDELFNGMMCIILSFNGLDLWRENMDNIQSAGSCSVGYLAVLLSQVAHCLLIISSLLSNGLTE